MTEEQTKRGLRLIRKVRVVNGEVMTMSQYVNYDLMPEKTYDSPQHVRGVEVKGAEKA